MVKQAYQIQKINAKKTAKAMMKNRPVSLKYSLELMAKIKGQRVDKSMAYIQRIINHEEFLPLRTYKKKMGHRKGETKHMTKVGRYPTRVMNTFLDLLNSVKANADYKGLDSDNLLITHMFASQGFSRMSSQSQGRIAGKMRKRKATHLEVVVQEAR